MPRNKARDQASPPLKSSTSQEGRESQAPPVKSGTSTGCPPAAIDCSESAERLRLQQFGEIGVTIFHRVIVSSFALGIPKGEIGIIFDQ